MKRFPSIKKNTDFQKTYLEADSHASREIVIYKRNNALGYNRLGISCSKKVGNSIVRHGMARKIREIFRINNYRLKQGFDIVVIVRKRAVYSNYRQIEKAYLNLCREHHILL